MKIKVSPDWYKEYFGSEWLDLARGQSSLERTQTEVDFIVRVADLSPGAPILDLCCGHGRHSIELARRGYRVTGLDISEPSLDLASSAAAVAAVEIEFVHGDMRRIPYHADFDLVINLFSAFGYLENETEDQKVLDAVARALRPGGRLLLDTINQAWLLRNFSQRSWSSLGDHGVMLEERAFDLRTGRSNATWTYLYADGRRHAQSHSMRVYTLVEFETMLRNAGLAIEQVWGNFDGDAYGLDTQRLILLAELKI